MVTPAHVVAETVKHKPAQGCLVLLVTGWGWECKEGWLQVGAAMVMAGQHRTSNSHQSRSPLSYSALHSRTLLQSFPGLQL